MLCAPLHLHARRVSLCAYSHALMLAFPLKLRHPISPPIQTQMTTTMSCWCALLIPFITWRQRRSALAGQTQPHYLAHLYRESFVSDVTALHNLFEPQCRVQAFFERACRRRFEWRQIVAGGGVGEWGRREWKCSRLLRVDDAGVMLGGVDGMSWCTAIGGGEWLVVHGPERNRYGLVRQVFGRLSGGDVGVVVK